MKNKPSIISFLIGCVLCTSLAPMVFANHRSGKALTKLRKVRGNFHLLHGLRGMKVLLNGGNRHDPVTSVPQMKARFLRGDRPRLQQQNARDQLQAVGNAVFHFLEQDLLLEQQILGLLEKVFLLAFDGAP